LRAMFLISLLIASCGLALWALNIPGPKLHGVSAEQLKAQAENLPAKIHGFRRFYANEVAP